jgi:hypothetical protein
MDAAIERALDPEIFIIPIPPRPPGVAMAAIVEFSIFLITPPRTIAKQNCK